jgi:hypothetical protein
MSSLIEEKKEAPIYHDNHDLSFQKLKDLMDVSNEVIAEIIDVSEATVRQKKVSYQTLTNSQPLIYTLNMLWILSEGNPELIRRWLHAPRIEWEGACPIDMLKTGRVGGVIRVLVNKLEGEQGGA